MRENIYNNNTSYLCLRDKNQKNLLNSSGVYKIGFIGSENFYIGSTTESFKIRFVRHFGDLKSGKHCNNILQSAYFKYNKEIYLDILEVCPPEKCIEREQYYFDILQPKYNICKFAGNTFGVKMPEKIVEMKSRKIDMFDLDGNFIKTYKSITSCGKENNVHSSSIAQAIKNKGTSNNYQFRYHGDFNFLPKYIDSSKIPILLYNKNGEFIKKFDSILDASIELNIPGGNISKHLSGLTKICYGYIFKKEKDKESVVEKYIKTHKFQQKIIITDLQTNEIKEFSSLRQIDNNICTRGTITIKHKKEGKEFILKNKYKVQIITCENNELTKT